VCFDNVGNRGHWWAATENDAGNAHYRCMGYGSDDVYEDDDNKDNGFSVR
jgi:hypothetical protein